VLPARPESAITGRRNQGLTEINPHAASEPVGVLLGEWFIQAEPVRSATESRIRPQAPLGGARRASRSEADETVNTSRMADPRRRRANAAGRRSLRCCSWAGPRRGLERPLARPGHGGSVSREPPRAAAEAAAPAVIHHRELIASVTFGAIRRWPHLVDQIR
jgi:hypothetical protein